MTDKEELIYDMEQESYYEGRREAVLRNDYNEFCENFAFEIEETVSAIKKLKEAHEKYGHSFCCKDWL